MEYYASVDLGSDIIEVPEVFAIIALLVVIAYLFDDFRGLKKEVELLKKKVEET